MNRKQLIFPILILMLTAFAYAESAQENWGNLDEMWLWRAFEVKDPFTLYSEASITSKELGITEKGAWLKLLDMPDSSWYLLRETSPPYRKGWVEGGSLVAEDKLVPVCSEFGAGGEEALMSTNPYLYYRKEKMPFTTVVASIETMVGQTNDKIVDLWVLDYTNDVFFLTPDDFFEPSYYLCIGVFKDKNKAEKIKRKLEKKGYKPFLFEIANENAGKSLSSHK